MRYGLPVDIYDESPLPAELSEQSDKAVYVDGVADIATARQLFGRVIEVADMIQLSEVHIWAQADALPLLAVAAAEIKDLPEGFQLREVAERPVEVVEGGLAWLSCDLLRRPVSVS